MNNGFIKVCASSPLVSVGNCEANANEIIKSIEKAADAGCSLVIFPELSITGYTCGDLFLQTLLIEKAMDSLMNISSATSDLDIIAVVGLPVKNGHKLYNCGCVFSHGQILGFVPKSNIPNYNEFCELRYFTAANDENSVITIGKTSYPFGAKLIFQWKEIPNFRLGVELCEDLSVPISPSSNLTCAGATIIANLSCNSETVGKDIFRESLVKNQSAICCCGYIYCNSGEGESTTDMVFSGNNIIAENGTIIAKNAPFQNSFIKGEIDLEKLEQEKKRLNTFPVNQEQFQTVVFSFPAKEISLSRKIEKFPFIPVQIDERNKRCHHILQIQSYALKKRIEHSHATKLVVGISGGLDSCLALLVCVRSMDLLGKSRKDILAITMPCFGTTKRTKSNAKSLSEGLGTSFSVIDIANSVNSHFKDIGHEKENLNVVFENAQARERTQVLMDIANSENGLVIGTGDLSELALGWATYNGDHMSMYGVNSSIPKTLIRHIVKYEADISNVPSVKESLLDILDTPVSPELLPAKNGEISQKTEDLVGPYELHDFFLFYCIRYGFSPSKIFFLACNAFVGDYSKETILRWLKVFYNRFFSQQFKRSCLPDGPKIGSVGLSPRGDWHMPSDASAALWLDSLSKIIL